MSYWTYVRVAAGERHEMDIYERNITYNNGPIFREAGVPRLRDLDGAPASEVAGLLDSARRKIRADPARFRQLDPPNGWGGTDDVLDWLDGVLAAMESEPSSYLVAH